MDRQRDLAFRRRMSDQEALMWNVEKDPWLNPNPTALAILDQPVEFELLVAKIRLALSRLSRLRERVVPGLGRLSPPVWATDREFDLAYHVRHIRLPEPGSLRQLMDLTTCLYEEPYDRTRPLWMFYAVDGLEDGRGALITKQHHAVADGIGALRMAEVYTDLERTASRPPEVDLDGIFAEAVEAEQSELLEAGADMSQSILDTATRTLLHNLRRQGGILSRAVGDVTGLVTNPAQVPGLIAGALGQVRSTVDAATGSRPIDASAPLWTHRSRRRHLEILHLPLDDVKIAAKALGGSVNDFFVAGAALGAFSYHDERGTPAQAINCTFVVSTRRDRGVGGNSFTPVPLQVPAAETLGVEERFHQIRDLMAERRVRISGAGPMSALAGVAKLLPTSVTTRVARDQAAKVDLATSNLRGAPFDTYVAGAKVMAIIPLGPLCGTAANLTTLSQNGMLDMGLVVDPAAVTDPPGLCRSIDEAYRRLFVAGGVISG
jgi:WS/DGAT/MGAT family acyltransferase